MEQYLLEMRKHGQHDDGEFDWRPVHLSNYARSVKNSDGWFAAADELQQAVDLLAPQVAGWWDGLKAWNSTPDRARTLPALGCHSIAMMLAAFVIENLCKGAMIRDGRVAVYPSVVTPQGIPKELRTHSLVKLVGAVEFSIDEQDEELLLRMWRAAVWRGRYPAAVRYDESIHTVRLAGGKKQSATWFGAADLPRINALIERLRGHLNVPRSFTRSRDAAP